MSDKSNVKTVNAPKGGKGKQKGPQGPDASSASKSQPKGKGELHPEVPPKLSAPSNGNKDGKNPISKMVPPYDRLKNLVQGKELFSYPSGQLSMAAAIRATGVIPYEDVGANSHADQACVRVRLLSEFCERLRPVIPTCSNPMRVLVLGPGTDEIASLKRKLDKMYGDLIVSGARMQFDVQGLRSVLDETDLARGRTLVEPPPGWQPEVMFSRDVYVHPREIGHLLAKRQWVLKAEFASVKMFNYPPNSTHFHSTLNSGVPELVVEGVAIHPALPGGVHYQGYTEVDAFGSVTYRPEPFGAIYKHEQNAYLFSCSTMDVELVRGVWQRVAWHTVKVMPDQFNVLVSFSRRHLAESEEKNTDVPLNFGPPYYPCTVVEGRLTTIESELRKRSAGLNPKSLDNVCRMPVHMNEVVTEALRPLLQRYGVLPGMKEFLTAAGDLAAKTCWEAPLPRVPAAGFDTCLRAVTEDQLSEHLSTTTNLPSGLTEVWKDFKHAKGSYDMWEALAKGVSKACGWVRDLFNSLVAWIKLTFGKAKDRAPYPALNREGGLSDKQMSMISAIIDLVSSFELEPLVKCWTAVVRTTPERFLALITKPFGQRSFYFALDIVMAIATSFLEETVKRIFPGAGLAFGIIEAAVLTAGKIKRGESLTWTFAAESLVRVVAHTGLSLMPFGVGAALHAAWNVLNAAVFGGPCVRYHALLKRQEQALLLLRDINKASSLKEEALPMSQSTLTPEQIPVGVKVILEPGMNPVPVTAEVIDHMVTVQEPPSDFYHSMAADPAILGHAKPVSSGVEICKMIRNRLQTPVPSSARQASAFKRQLAYLETFENLGLLHGKTWEEFREWAKQKYTGTKLASYLKDLDEVEGLVMQSFKARDASVKTDEALIARFSALEAQFVYELALGMEGSTKTRPLHMRQVQDLIGMFYAESIKEMLAVMFIFDGEKRLCRAYEEDQPLYVPTTARCFVLFYAARVNSEILSRVTSHFQLYGIKAQFIHGDDNKLQFHFGKEEVSFASASDLGSCDLTVGPGAHKEAMEFFQRRGFPSDAAAAHIHSTSGKRKAVTKLPWLMTIIWRVISSKAHTATGVPLTAIMAALALIVAGLETARQFFDTRLTNDPFFHLAPEDFSLLWTESLNQVLTRNGHIVEPETNAVTQSIIHPLSGVTFLGQFAVQIEWGDVRYVEIQQTKTLKVHIEAYDPVLTTALAKWAYAAAQQPGLSGTEHSRAMRSLLLRTETHWCGDKPLTDQQKAEALKVHENLKGQFKTEVEGNYSQSQIEDIDFLVSLQRLAKVRGVKDVVARYQSSKAALEGTPFLPTMNNLGFDVFYELRYGKEIPETVGFQLSMIDALLNWSQWGGATFENNMQSNAKKSKKLQGAANQSSSFLKAASKIPRSMPDALGHQMRALSEPLTRQDEAIFGYLSTIADPFIKVPTGVPLVLGSGGVTTIKAVIPRTFSVAAGTSGFGFLTMNADNWIGPDDTGVLVSAYRYATNPGTTGGKNVFYSGATYAGTALPAATDSVVTGMTGSPMPTVDSSWSATTNYRMVAMGLRVWPDDAAQTTKGDIYVVSTSEPYGLAATGALPLMSESTLTSLNSEIISVAAAPLAGWKSGKVMQTSAIPSDGQCFEFTSNNTTTNAGFGYPQIGVIMTGCAVGQSIKVQTVFVYEYEKTQTNNVNDQVEPTVAGGDMMPTGLTHLAKVGTSIKPAYVHESSNMASHKGAHAFANTLVETRPLKLPSLAIEARSPSIDWGATAKHALNFSSKVLSNLPGVGGLLGKGASFLGNLLF